MEQTKISKNHRKGDMNSYVTYSDMIMSVLYTCVWQQIWKHRGITDFFLVYDDQNWPKSKWKTGKDQFHREDQKSDLRCTMAKSTRECWINIIKLSQKHIWAQKEVRTISKE